MLIIPVEKKTSVGKIKSSTNDKESCITVRIHTKEAKKLNIVRWRSQTTIPKLYSLQMLPNKRSSNSETMIQFIFIGSSKMGSSILEIVPISVQHLINVIIKYLINVRVKILQPSQSRSKWFVVLVNFTETNRFKIEN